MNKTTFRHSRFAEKWCTVDKKEHGLTEEKQGVVELCDLRHDQFPQLVWTIVRNTPWRGVYSSSAQLLQEVNKT